MAYMSQEKKAALAPAIKAICAKYGVKASLSVNHHSTLVLSIKSAPIDFIANCNRVAATRPEPYPGYRNPAKDYLQVNEHWYTEHYDGTALSFLSEVIPAMSVGNHDNSDIQTDFFDIGFYININVGSWNKPFLCTGNKEQQPAELCYN